MGSGGGRLASAKIAKNRKMTNEKKSLLLSCSHNVQPELYTILYILNTPNFVLCGAFICC